MRVLCESLGLVSLLDFPYGVESINLLLLLQRHCENIPLRVLTPNGETLFVSAFRLITNRESLRMLNPG